MPPPELKNDVIAEKCDAMLAMPVGELSQPPHELSDATMKAL